MGGLKRILLCLLILFSLQILFVFADELVVGVKPAAPFVIVSESGDLSGFSIDLINEVANEMDDEITFVLDSDLQTHFKTVQENKVDMGIAATTITAERLKQMEFSHPFYASSLGLMVLENNNRLGLIKAIFRPEYGQFVLISFFILAINANIYWYLERKRVFKGRSYKNAIIRSAWWNFTTMIPTRKTVNYDDYSPRTKIGKIYAVYVIVVGVILFGIAIAGLSSILTLSQLGSSINGPSDLANRPVGVIAGTQSEVVAKDFGFSVIQIKDLNEGAKLLQQGKVDAIIHDTPLLLYHIKESKNDKLLLAPKTFFQNDYGIIFPKETQIEQEVDLALLQVMESGVYDEIHEKWFGEK